MKHLKPPAGIEVHYRLNFIKSSLLLGMAVIFDTLQFLLSLTGIGEIVSEILALIADVLIPMVAYFMGVSYGGKKGMLKKLTVIFTGAIELVPFLNDIPTYTIETIILISLTRIEDIEEAIEKAKKQKGLAKAQQRQIGWHQKYATRMRQDLQGIAAQQQAATTAASPKETEEKQALEQNYGGVSSITQTGGRSAFSYGSSSTQGRPLDLRTSGSSPEAKMGAGNGLRYAPANENAPQLAAPKPGVTEGAAPGRQRSQTLQELFDPRYDYTNQDPNVSREAFKPADTNTTPPGGSGSIKYNEPSKLARATSNVINYLHRPRQYNDSGIQNESGKRAT